MDAARALADRLTSAVRRSPEWLQFDAYRLAARLFLDLGDPGMASESRQLAQSMGEQSMAAVAEGPGWRVPDSIVEEQYAEASAARHALKDDAGAEETLARGLARLPKSLKLLAARARLALALGRRDEAAEAARRLLETARAETVADVVRRQPPNLLADKEAERAGASDAERLKIFLADAPTAAALNKTLQADRAQAERESAAILQLSTPTPTAQESP